MRTTKRTMDARCFFLMIAMLALCCHTMAADPGPAKLLDFTKGDKPPADAAAFNLHIGMCSGAPNGTTPRGGDGNQLLVVKYAEGQHIFPIKISGFQDEMLRGEKP